jgi:hypothetical protein
MTANKTITTTEADETTAPKAAPRKSSNSGENTDPNMRFHARLQPAEGGMSSGRFHVPPHLVPVLGAKAAVPVHGTLDGLPFTSSLVPDGEGGMFLPVDQSLRAKAQLKPGDIVEIVLQAIG